MLWAGLKVSEALVTTLGKAARCKQHGELQSRKCFTPSGLSRAGVQRDTVAFLTQGQGNQKAEGGPYAKNCAEKSRSKQGRSHWGWNSGSNSGIETKRK